MPDAGGAVILRERSRTEWTFSETLYIGESTSDLLKSGLQLPERMRENADFACLTLFGLSNVFAADAAAARAAGRQQDHLLACAAVVALAAIDNASGVCEGSCVASRANERSTGTQHNFALENQLNFRACIAGNGGRRGKVLEVAAFHGPA